MRKNPIIELWLILFDTLLKSKAPQRVKVRIALPVEAAWHHIGIDELRQIYLHPLLAAASLSWATGRGANLETTM